MDLAYFEAAAISHIPLFETVVITCKHSGFTFVVVGLNISLVQVLTDTVYAELQSSYTPE